jgi:hypothetical protein
VPATVGNDAASSAQSKRAVTGVELGGIGPEGGETRDGGCKTGPGGSSDMVAAMEDGGDDETARFRGTGGTSGGCRDAPGSVLCRFSAVACGPE